MVHGGGGVTDLPPKAKLCKMQQKIGLTGATHWGRHTRCSQPNPNATTEQTAAQCVPYTTRARHCKIVGGLSKCHSFFQ